MDAPSTSDRDSASFTTPHSWNGHGEARASPRHAQSYGAGDVRDAPGSGGANVAVNNRMAYLSIEQRLLQSSGKRARHPSYKYSPTPSPRRDSSPTRGRSRQILGDTSGNRSPTKKKPNSRLRLVKCEELPREISHLENEQVSSDDSSEVSMRASNSGGSRRRWADPTGPSPRTPYKSENARPMQANGSTGLRDAPLNRPGPATKFHHDSDDVFKDDVPMGGSSPGFFDTPLNRSDSGKRRKTSGYMPEPKRLRSPFKTPSTAPSFKQPMMRSHDDGDLRAPYSLPLRVKNTGARVTKLDVAGITYEADDKEETLRIVFPGDPPVTDDVKREEAGSRGQTASPRTVTRIFAATRELTRQARDASGVTGAQDIHSMFARPGQEVEIESLREEVRGRLLAAYMDRPHPLRNHGCASGRLKQPEDNRPVSAGGRSANSDGSGVLRETGFIGGFKLTMAGRRIPGASGSDSDSGKERRDKSRVEPDSRVTPPVSEGDSDHGEGPQAGPSVVSPPSPAKAQVSAFDGTDDRPTGVSTSEQALSDVENAGPMDHTHDEDARVVVDKGKKVDRSEQVPARESSSRHSASTRETKSTARNSRSISVSGSVEPITPVTPAEDVRRSITPESKSIKEAVEEALNTDIARA